MLGILIEKELKAILLSPKFSVTFGVCSILIVFSIFIGIQEFNVDSNAYEVSNNLAKQNAREQLYWQSLNNRVYREPDPMHIFVSGVHNDIGKGANINQSSIIKLGNSYYSENTIFAVFRFMDLAFIVQIVLSLFAIVFTFDAINGERERGTLKLNFASPIPRSQYILAKFIGSWLGLTLPLLIPLLLGILLVLLYDIPMTADKWIQLLVFLLVSILYFTFFIALGLLLSALTKNSSSSFLFLLVIWISTVFIIPRAGVMISGQIVSVPSSAEISSKQAQFSRDIFQQQSEKTDRLSVENAAAYNSIVADGTPEENQRKFAKVQSDYSLKSEEIRAESNRQIGEYDRSLNEDWRNRQIERERFGFALSRISPASSFQLAVMEIADTSANLKFSTENQMRDYSSTFLTYRAAKVVENISEPISVTNTMPLDLTDMPEFEFKTVDVEKAIQATLLDIGLLAFYTLMALAGTFFAFLRYDVR